MLVPSTPGAPRLARTSPHALTRMSARATLSYRAWNRRVGSCLALRYSTACKARDASRPSAFLMVLALIGHSPVPLFARACIGEVGALPSGRVVLSRPSPVLRPPPTASRRPHHFPGDPVIGGYRFPGPRAPGPRRLSPVPTATLRPFNAPYAEGFFGARSRFRDAFRGLRPVSTGSAPP
jgi:hypothetical protein